MSPVDISRLSFSSAISKVPHGEDQFERRALVNIERCKQFEHLWQFQKQQLMIVEARHANVQSVDP